MPLKYSHFAAAEVNDFPPGLKSKPCFRWTLVNTQDIALPDASPGSILGLQAEREIRDRSP